VKQLEKFLNSLEHQKGYSELTCSKYREILESWVNWWQNLMVKESQTQPEIKEPMWSKDTLREYLYYLREEKCFSSASLAQTISCFKSFDKYLLRSNLVTKQITQSIKTPKKEQTLVDFISQKVLDVKVPENMDEITMRRWTIFEIFYGSGIRLAELENLKWSDLNLTQGSIKILGKGKKERIAPLSSKAISLLIKIAESRGFKLSDKNIRNKHHPIFLSSRNTPLSRSSIQKDMQSFLQGLGWQGKASPHMLRHSFATHMMENGAEILSVKDLLGHSSVKSTQVYTHVTQDQIMKKFQQAHPRAKK